MSFVKYLTPYLEKINDALLQLGGRQKETVVLDKALFEEIIKTRCEKECLTCGKCPAATAAAGNDREPKKHERKRIREHSLDDISVSASSATRPAYSNRRRRFKRY